MTSLNLLLLALAAGAVLWAARRLPLDGRRAVAATALRLVAVSAVCLALWGWQHRRTHETPRHVVYLVDQSGSVDEAQTRWMAQRIASLEAQRPGPVRRAVLAFGERVQTVVPFGTDRLTDPAGLAQTLRQAEVGRERTNLEQALLGVLGEVPAGQRVAVVLLSDGWETSGDVSAILAYARRLGVEVYPAPPQPGGRAQTVWERLAVPPVASRGSPVGLELVVDNPAGQAKRGTVTVSVRGTPIKRQRVTIKPGWQVLRTSVPAVQPGTLALTVELTIPEDHVQEQRSAYVEVEGPPRVLLVTDQTAVLPPLGQALKRRGLEVATLRPAELPAASARLTDYDGVILHNVAKSTLTEEQAGALDRYVREEGGGVVMVGLGGELAEELERHSPLDPLLPVIYEPKGLQEAKQRVCVILLIDRSASMLGPRIAATKRAAVELVNQLAPEDLVGIMAFDTQPYVVAEVQPARQVGQWLVEKLVRLRSSGGTDVYPALAMAAEWLDLTGATVKHIILLSDGNTPIRGKSYEALIESMRLHGTSVSTIGIGSVFINEQFLQWLADSTGGTFYVMHTLDELPTLVARDTHTAKGNLPFTEGAVRPHRTPSSDWFADTDEWPILRGYLTTTAKPGATVDLVVSRPGPPAADGSPAVPAEDPVFARWTPGRGRVVAFTSDADTRWSSDWIRWDGFEATWASVVRWAMRPRLAEELFIRVDQGQPVPQLAVDGALQDPHAELIAADGQGHIPLSLAQTGTWQWQASLEQIPSGWYQLVLDSAVGEPAPGSSAAPRGIAKRWIQIGTPPAPAETTGQPPRETFLRQLALGTGGAYDAPDRALVPPTTPTTTTEPLFAWWLPLVILALLVDVAIRGSTML